MAISSNVLYTRFVILLVVVMLFFQAYLYIFFMSSSSADVETHAILLSRLNETLHQLNGELKSLRSSKHPVGNVDNSHNPLTPLKSNEIARQATANIDTTMRLQGTSSSSLLAPSQITTKSGNSPLLTSENTSKGIKKKALIFTMDSIPTYEENSLSGGAAGELLIRHSLEAAFKHFNVDVRVIKSDREFEESNAKVYDFIILDPWTWAAKGWVPKKVIRGLDDKIFILDFFGSEGLRGNELKIPKSRILTAYGSPWNTFLGYFIDESKIPPPPPPPSSSTTRKVKQGVIWGKDVKHLTPHVRLLQQLAEYVPLVSGSTMPAFSHLNVKWIGHMSSAQWKTLLASSKFLLGLGDPLLGPSAIDCIVAGCVYINPIYATPVRNGFQSQHPYADKNIGAPYVCSYKIDDIDSLKVCVDKALSVDLPPYIPPALSRDAYFDRVKQIFNLT